METPRHCAFNQSKECFLGLHITPVDLPYTRLRDAFGSLALKADEGICIHPFRGIPTTDVRVPVDLIYLSREGIVLDVVESFPANLPSSSSSEVSSVLVLPGQSIANSQTRFGDLVLVCAADEMQAHLQHRVSFGASGRIASRSYSDAGSSRERAKGRQDAAAVYSAAQSQTPSASRSGFKSPKNWLERLLTPDPRRAPRHPASRLVAYYFNGASPQARSVRDLSETGFYLYTEERWYPGTIVLMTLQRTDCADTDPLRALTVQAQAVRLGNDGIGFKFLPFDARQTQNMVGDMRSGADRKDLDRFLQQLNLGRE
jgi:hypothetical protein